MANKRLSNDAILSQLPAARARSKKALAERVRAKSASINRQKGLLVIALTNGSTFSVPIKKVPGLELASIEDVARVALDSFGMGLHWDQLDVDISVAGLAHLVLGESNLLAAAGKVGGEAKTAAKAEAARRNGLNGGRPPKFGARNAKRSSAMATKDRFVSKKAVRRVSVKSSRTDK